MFYRRRWLLDSEQETDNEQGRCRCCARGGDGNHRHPDRATSGLWLKAGRRPAKNYYRLDPFKIKDKGRPHCVQT